MLNAELLDHCKPPFIEFEFNIVENLYILDLATYALNKSLALFNEKVQSYNTSSTNNLFIVGWGKLCGVILFYQFKFTISETTTLLRITFRHLKIN